MYSTIDNIVKSLRTAWKYKILWVFALVIGSGGIIIHYSFLHSLPSTQVRDQQQTSSNDYDAESVLGVTSFGEPADSSVFDFDWDPEYSPPTVGQFLLNFLAVFLAITIFIIFTVFLWLVVSSWAMGSLIAGTDVASENRELNLRGLSDLGIKKIKEIIKLRVLVFALWFMITTVFILAAIPLFTLLDGIIVYILLVVVLLLLFLITSALLVYSLLFGMRYVVLLDKNASEAFILGMRAFKTNLDRSILLSLGNFFVHAGMITLTLAVFALPFAYLVMFLIGPFYNMDKGFGFYLPIFPLHIMLLLVPLGLVVVVFYMAMAGFVKTYKYIAWTNLFRYVEKKPEEGNSNGI